MLNGITTRHQNPPQSTSDAEGRNMAMSIDRPGDVRQIFTPIAICGMACRLPGRVHSPQELWDFLLSKGDARTRVPETRYNVSAFHWPTKKAGHTITEHGYFLDKSVDLGALDTSMFPMARSELEALDPQQRILFEVARESLDDAGEVDWKGTNVGVYVGNFGNDWYDLQQKESQRYGTYHVSTSHDFAVSNRVPHEMDLRGPSMTIRTACSSSLVALTEACTAIAKGDCPSAIVAGTSIIMAPSLTTDISNQNALSPEGSCKTFSARADGYARGEGIVALYVKSLHDALRDGNPVRAVIVGAATNCDGKTPGFTVPSADAQESLIRHTYRVAGIDEPDIPKTGYFECHGTGTPSGDFIETSAIAKVFGASGGICIGVSNPNIFSRVLKLTSWDQSVKPNLGHGEGVSGLTAVLKAVLSLENRTILPSIKCLPLNEKIPFDSSQLTIPMEPTPWPAGRYERVSVNSFGIGGSNAHAIIDSTRAFLECGDEISREKNPLDVPQLLLYSASSTQSLKDMIDRYSVYLNTAPASLSLADVAYTLARRREQLPFRSFEVRSRFQPGEASLPTHLSKCPLIAMVFTGQGAQWPQMGRQLLRTNVVFSQTIKALDDHLQDLSAFAPNWKLEDELLKPARTSRVNEAEFAQPLCSAIQIALVDTLASIGIRPWAVVGHSSGEIAAAYAAGGLTAQQAIIIAYYRGLVCTRAATTPGAMAAVGLSWKETEKFLVSGVVVACENSPSNVTLSGDEDKIKLVLAAIKQSFPSSLTSILKVEKAYHSHHMLKVGNEYRSLMINSGVTGRPPSLPFFSSVAGGLLPSKDNAGFVNPCFGPDYWQKNLESPVLFKDAVSHLLDHPLPTPEHSMVILEVGPHPALAGPLRQILSANTRRLTVLDIMPTIVRRQDSMENFLTIAGKLWAFHANMDFSALVPRGKCLPNLPRYPWNHQRSYWTESRVASEWRFCKNPYHDLLGMKIPETSEIQPAWRNLLHLENASWLCDHKIKNDIVFPFAAYVAMAAEAISQVTGVRDAVELRHVRVTTALVLSMDAPTELVTTLRPRRLTEFLDSHWWEFTITAHTGHTWTKHSFGEVRAITKTSLGQHYTPDEQVAPHEVSVRQWYERVSRGGIRYGSHFRKLDQIRTSTSGPKGTAVATMQNDWAPDESKAYYMHPVVLDTLFQLMGAAAHHGFTHAYGQGVPSSTANIALSRCSSDHLTLVTNCERIGNTMVGDGSCLGTDSAACLRVSGVRFSDLDGEDEMNDIPTTAQAEWVPHVDFLDLDVLIKPAPNHISQHLQDLELLSQMAVTASCRSLTPSWAFPNPKDHVQKYRAWLEEQTFPELESLGNDTLMNQIKILCDSLSEDSLAPAARAILKLVANAADIGSGEIEPLDVLHEDNTLDKLNRFLAEFDATEFLRCAAHCNPNLRILELGTGMGPSMINILERLKRPNGQLLYSQIYATPCISQSLSHVHKLLSPNGHLLLQQPREGLTWIKYVLGALPGWWCGSGDGRDDQPFMSMRKWEEVLVNAGFHGLDSYNHYDLSTIMIARVRGQSEKSTKKVTLLYDAENEVSDLFEFEKTLVSQGFQVSCYPSDSVIPVDRDIIAFLDKTKPSLESIKEPSFQVLKDLVQRIESSKSGILWVTNPTQIQCQDPRFAPIVGLARTLRLEKNIDFATCEVDDMESPAAIRAVTNVFRRFHERDSGANQDFEYVISGGVVYVNRVFPLSLADTTQETLALRREAALKIGRPGLLDSLQWFSAPPMMDLKEYEVEIEVSAVGFNFRDVLEATGVIELPTGQQRGIGIEASGIVRRVGPEVTKVSVGDRVVAMGESTFSTVVTTTEMLCEKMPDGMSFVDGASMPIAFQTAIYALLNIGHLEEGQSVLIHSGCGGVGLACIQIARMLGAEIYTTVGTEEKVKHLMETFAIPRNRIFISRHSTFLNEILLETNGKGVDLAVNSLSGDLLHATWRCVAKWGTMVEIGKVDSLGAARLDMDMFLGSRNYCCFDLRQMAMERPHMINRLLGSMMEYHRFGQISPIRVDRVFQASEVRDAFRFMQKGSHIGKIVMTLRDDDRNIDFSNEIIPRQLTVTLDPSASYLLVGGLGGLGRSVAIWMVQHGARNLTFLSRSVGDSPQEGGFVRMLDSMGCNTKLVRGSVTKAVDVSRAIDATVQPLRGIIHMGMVLRDRAFSQMTIDDWDCVTAPKIRGTWNLHNISCARGIDLDFFILFSSLSGIMGQPGQANYAAANAFLDAFMQFRIAMGLPCTTLDIGAMEGIGHLSENEGLLRKMRGMGWQPVKEEELLEALGAAMLSSLSAEADQQTPVLRKDNLSPIKNRSSLLVGISASSSTDDFDSTISTRLSRDIRMAAYLNLGDTGRAEFSGKTDALRVCLAEAKKKPALFRRDETAAVLAREIGKKLSNLLLKPDDNPNIASSLTALGLDSLIAVELRAWCKQAIGIDMSVLEMLAMGTLEALGKNVAKRLAKLYDD
ncbi:hypothetical protein F4779DRAFT_633577 [Xylariaceae sp. FL0662B]|nr:hypothetical protein F4779DRAFT_633577 [Xylariaceae sp. FL0662B]